MPPGQNTDNVKDGFGFRHTYAFVKRQNVEIQILDLKV
jgi:hypothetical protein